MAQRLSVPLVANLQLAPHTFVLRLGECGFLTETRPGQFIMLLGEDWGTDPLLPRAFSLLAVHGESGEVDVLVKTTGKGSALLERALPGARFRVLGPLGGCFPPPDPGRRDLLIAGGVGLAPLMMQARLAARLGLAHRATLFYGGRSAADLVLLDDIERTGVGLVLATEDGSRGERGYVTAAVDRFLDRSLERPGDRSLERPGDRSLERPGDRSLERPGDGSVRASAGDVPTLLACGPEPMLEAVARLAHRRGVPAYLSLEGEMACGIGACLACAVACKGRPFRYVCVDGPVFDLAELRGPYAAESTETAESAESARSIQSVRSVEPG